MLSPQSFRKTLAAAFALAVLVFAPSSVRADGPGGGGDDEAPELPPAAVAGALTLVAGGIVLLRDRLAASAKQS